jgi:cell division protein ZapE
MQEQDSDGPLRAYHARCMASDLCFDSMQERAAKALDALSRRLTVLPAVPKRGFRLFGKRPQRMAEAPRGIYLHGGVGRGKTMLMDLFFDCLPITRKQRVHFHAFMQDVHRAINATKTAADAPDSDPIPPLAESIAASAEVLCFDEFHVTDIADAMILGRLFEALFEAGVVPVITSNRHPDELYKNGINRPLFLPFIAMINERLKVIALDGPQDYRQLFLLQARLYHTPLGAGADRALDQAFARLSGHASPEPVILTVQGRTLRVPSAAKGVACLSFQELCEQPLGPADYLALAGFFHTIVLNGIPRLSAERRNEAKRFVALIDVLYEHKVHFICAADALPNELYPAGDGSFEFQRTASRLIEMQSENYVTAIHEVGPKEQDS